MARLKTFLQTAGGGKLAVETIEREYINNGNAHLRDDVGMKKIKKMNWCTSLCCDCFWFAFLVALIYFTVMYFVISSDIGMR